MAMFRGLNNFIADIRKCRNKEAEQARVDKELANIRKNFTGSRLSSYDRKKYTWKLVYIHILGYDVDFGTSEMLQLLRGSSFSEKVAGYLAAQVLLRHSDDQVGAVISAIKDDLRTSIDSVQSIALSSIGNMGGKAITESLSGSVVDIIFSRSTFPAVRRKAVMCMLRMYRVDNTILPADQNIDRLTRLLSDGDLTVRYATWTLLQEMARKNQEVLESILPLAVKHLRAICQHQVPEQYKYHHTFAPWYQVRLLQVLQAFPPPTDDGVVANLDECLRFILTNTKITRSVNRNNAEHSVLFEAVSLIIKYGESGNYELRTLAVEHLTRFVHIREPNIRYLGLDAMTRLVRLQGPSEGLKKQQEAIFISLKDPDISIRRRALDLLFVMCDKQSAMSIVKELLSYLVVAEYDIKEEMVLKLAILAERFAPDLRWYVDTVLQLISTAGDFVSNHVWFRVVQIVTNDKSLHKYAAWKMYRALESSLAHEATVRVGGYLVGEFGYLLTAEPEIGEESDDIQFVSSMQQFDALKQHFDKVGIDTKCIILNALVKLQNLHSDLREPINAIFREQSRVIDTELQQRAVEYLQLPNMSSDLREHVLESMPDFPDRESALELELKKREKESRDRDEWGKEAADDEDASDEDEKVSDTSEQKQIRASLPTHGSAAPGNSDLLSLDEPAKPPSQPDTTASSTTDLPTRVENRIQLDESTASARRKWLLDLVVQPNGVLYQDPYVQIGVKKQFNGPEGDVRLFIGNRTSGHLNMLKVRVPPTTGLEIEVGEVPSVVGPKKQIQVAIHVKCSRPFDTSPQLQISFISAPANGHAYGLTLPVALTHFCEGANIPQSTFADLWKALEAAPKRDELMLSGQLSSFSRILQSIGFMCVAQEGSHSDFASSFKTTATTPTGALVSIGCLLRVSQNNDQLHIDIRTRHGLVTQALAQVFQRLSSML